jgi:probable nitrogen fixation protein
MTKIDGGSMTTKQVIDPKDPVLESDFAVELMRQVRAVDSYGMFENYSAAQILDPFILTDERKRAIPVVADPDEITISRVIAFYNTIAGLIEKECGLMATSYVSITHEGFGRALIVVGKLVVMNKVLRDVHRFGFPSVSKMKDEADKVLSVALNMVGDHSAVAGL